MDDTRTVEVVNEDEDGNPIAVIVRDTSRNTAEYHIVLPVLTHTERGPVIAPTAFCWDLN